MPAPTRPLPFVSESGVSVIGHRGAADLAIENTASAMRAGVKAGARGVEWDVQNTADGALVIFHDETLERLIGDPRRIRDMTLAEVKAVDLGGGERILTLNEALVLMRELPDISMNLEVKTLSQGRIEEDKWISPTPADGFELGRQVAQALKAFPDLRERMMISSFDPQGIEGFRTIDEELAASLLFEEKNAPMYRERFPEVRPGAYDYVGQMANEVGAQGVGLKHTLVQPQMMEALRRQGISPATVSVYTIDDAGGMATTPEQLAQRLTRMQTAGVGAVFANDPATVAAALRKGD
ncbi:MAG: glycerophosphodiester phosphodiesterase [Myxococcaceae bacterium]